MSPAAGPVRGTAYAVANRDTTARACVEESLRRIAAAAGLRAVVALRADAALAEADALDAEVDAEHRAHRTRADAVAAVLERRPLAGVPVLVKDLEDVAGMPTRRGSRLFADALPATSDEVVPQRYRAAGGVVVGKTALPELAIEGFTASTAHGVTHNPWNPERSPGGSSGGSGAALAAGLAPVATATDGGGSVRIPAAFCGLLGLKPTHGLVGRRPAADWLDLSTYGPLAHDAADLRLLLRLMTGVVDGDPDSAPAPDLGPGGPVRRVLVAPRTSPLGPLPDGVASRLRTGVEALVGVLADGGPAPVVEHLDPAALFEGIGDPDHDWFVLAPAEHVASLAEALGGRDAVARAVEHGPLDTSTRQFLEVGLGVDVDAYLTARRRRAAYTGVLDRLLGDDAVLVTPTVAVDAWIADGRVVRDAAPALLPPEVFSTAVQNVTGHPAVSLPHGLDTHGVPSGLQVTAPRWRDGLLLGVAARWQEAHPWPVAAPGYAPWPTWGR